MKVFVDSQGLLTAPGADRAAVRRAADRRRLARRMALEDPGRAWRLLATAENESLEGFDALAEAFEVVTLPDLLFAAGPPEEALARGLVYAEILDDLAEREDFYWSLAPLDPGHVFPLGLSVPRVLATLDDCGRWFSAGLRRRGGEAASDPGDERLETWRERLQSVVSAADALAFSSETAAAEARMILSSGLRGVVTAPFWGALDPAFTPAGRLEPGAEDPAGGGAYALLVADGASPERLTELRHRLLNAIARSTVTERGPLTVVVLTPEGALEGADTAAGPAPGVPLTEPERAQWIRRAAVVVIAAEGAATAGRATLEALACGRPTLVPDRPAPREAAGAQAQVYEPESVESIMPALERAMVESGERAVTARAARAAEAAGEPVAAYRTLFHEASRRPAPMPRRPRVAILGPWPPQRSPVAAYSMRFAQALTQWADVEVFVEGEEVPALTPLSGVTLHGIDAFRADAPFDRVFVHLANSPTHHARSFALAYGLPGVDLILHADGLHPLARALYTEGVAPMVYLHALEHLYSMAEIEEHRDQGFARLPVSEGMMLGALSYDARRIIAHDAAAQAAVEAERKLMRGEIEPSPVLVWPQPLTPPAPARASAPDPGAFVIGLFLGDAEGMASARAAAALAALRRLGEMGLPARLRVFRAAPIGKPAPALSESDLSGVAVELVSARFDLDAAPELGERLRSCDLWLSLPERGAEAPGPLIDPGLIVGLEAGLPCLVAGDAPLEAQARGLAAFVLLGESAEMRDPASGESAERLAKALRDLLLSPSRRRVLSSGAGGVVAAHRSWSGFTEIALFDE